MVRRRGLVAIAVACPLVWALASVAEARPKSEPMGHHVAVPLLARQGEHASAGASVPREPLRVTPVAEEALQKPTIDGVSSAIEVSAVPLTAAAVTPIFVDPAGGHARVHPIETASPYRDQ